MQYYRKSLIVCFIILIEFQKADVMTVEIDIGKLLLK